MPTENTANFSYLLQNFTDTSYSIWIIRHGRFHQQYALQQQWQSGSIQVFQIPVGTMPVNTPFEVYTTDTDASVNTNLALFYLGKDVNNNNATAYVPIPFTGPSFDYYPADRSTVDAEVNVNNTDLVPTQFYQRRNLRFSR